MILLALSSMVEAKPIIKKLNLSAIKINGFKWSAYTNDISSVVLYITGIGPINAAAATSSILTYFACKEDILLVNIGTCASASASKATIGQLFLINKLTDGTTKKTYYPDICIGSAFSESSITSLATPFKGIEYIDCEKHNTDSLYDMEAAFIYQSAMNFLTQDKILFLKIVSDYGTNNSSMAELKAKISDAIEINLDCICDFINQQTIYLSPVSMTESPAKTNLADVVSLQLYDDLKCSTTMSHFLKQLIKYSATISFDIDDFFSNLYKEGLLPCQSKKDGLKLLNDLKNQLINY